MKNKFFEDMTFEEWAIRQDKKSIEFRSIKTGHENYPGYTLEDIKREMYVNFIITEENQRPFIQSFGDRHPDSEKLNMQMKELTRIIFSPAIGSGDGQGKKVKDKSGRYKQQYGYQIVDEKGHGDVVTVRLTEEREKISFRIEEKALSYAKYLIAHNQIDARFASDIVRDGFIKYIQMLPIIREIRDACTEDFIKDMKIDIETLEENKINIRLEGLKHRLKSKEKTMMEASSFAEENKKNTFADLKTWIEEFIRDTLSTGHTSYEKGRLKRFIMEDITLFSILSRLEGEGLITREYVDSLRRKGVIFSNLDASQTEELGDK
jgi:hypothetical protein